MRSTAWIAAADTWMTGVVPSTGSALICSQTSKPVMSGSRTSSTTRSMPPSPEPRRAPRRRSPPRSPRSRPGAASSPARTAWTGCRRRPARRCASSRLIGRPRRGTTVLRTTTHRSSSVVAVLSRIAAVRAAAGWPISSCGYAVSTTTGTSAQRRVGGQAVQHREPVELGQPQVEQDHVGHAYVRRRQRGPAVGGLVDGETAAAQHPAGRRAEPLVVVDHEHADRRRVARGVGGGADRQPHRERAARRRAR